MKRSFSFFLLLLFMATGLSAQKRGGNINLQYISKSKDKAAKESRSLPNREDLKIYSSSTESTNKTLEQLDTLNYPLPGTYAIYVDEEDQFVSGTNSYGDLAKADVFEYGQPSVLKGVLIDFALASSSNTQVEIAAWDNSGADGSPGVKIASTQVLLDDIFIDVLNDQTTYIPFETPVALTSTFYLGVVLPQGSDTLVLFTNTHEDTDPTTAWEQWSDGEWHDYEFYWDLKVAHAIFPIVDADVGLLANFFADATAINPGTTVEFFDTSIGGATSWAWTFDGGNPANSNEQQPLITYPNEGLYDVQLIVGNGETFDTLLREDYILVTDEIPVETDTLAYPLEGTRVLYRIKDEQGVYHGFICGTNLYGELAFANYFSPQEVVKITGMVFDFAVAKGDEQPITLGIWNNQGDNGGPGEMIKSASLPLSTIKSDVANSMLTTIYFDQPLTRSAPFYAGFHVPGGTNDSLAVWSNTAGDTFPGVGWSQWPDPAWVPFTHPSSWGSDFNITMGVHPIVEYQTGIRDLEEIRDLVVYPNPTKGKIQVDLSEFTGRKNIEVVDITGGVILTAQANSSQNTLLLDLSDQYTGIYFVRVTAGNRIGVQKVVRN